VADDFIVGFNGRVLMLGAAAGVAAQNVTEAPGVLGAPEPGDPDVLL
jgi:hypothetical protein